MHLTNVLRPYYVYRPRQILARLWRTRAPQRGLRRTVMPWGYDFEVDPSETIGHAVWNNGIHDLLVSEALWRLADPGATAVDVGANIGCMTSLLAARLGSDGKVISLEPHPEVAAALGRNVALARRRGTAASVAVITEAAGDQPGMARLVFDDDFATNHGTAHLADGGTAGAEARGHDVRVTTLDTVIGDASVQVMKVDVEGHEPAVFRGAKRALSERRIKHIIYEDNDRGASPVHEQLASHGYRVFALGWRLNGPLVGGRDELLARDDEAPSYAATADADELLRRMQPRGWRCLRGR
jgi:FkbM family methyltransferase